MSLELRLGDWSSLGPQALAIREAVFVVEQGVPVELEQDDQDAASLHALALLDGTAVGTGRLTLDGHIGRMAVRRDVRRRGVGAAILRALLAAAEERGHATLRLNAQLAAIPFYETLGFVAEGPVFDDAGIAHRRMHFGAARRKV